MRSIVITATPVTSRGDLASRGGRELSRRVVSSRTAGPRGARNETWASSSSDGGRRYVREGHVNVDIERQRGNCYGCGVSLQTKNASIAGFVDPEEYATKATHRQYNMMLCARCSELSNGKFINAVEGQGGLKAAPGLITPKQLRDQLTPIREKKVLVVKVVDVTDFHGSFLKKVRDIVGGNPILLVVTKVDLLGGNVDEEALKEWIVHEAESRKLTLAGIALVSSKKGSGMRDAVLQMMRERRGRDVYVLGAANVGKSTFIRAAMEDLRSVGNHFAPRKRLPVASAMPGTTLGIIPLQAFEGKGVLYDTPGLFLHHRLNSLLGPEDLSAMRLGSSLKCYAPKTPECAKPPGFASFEGYSLFWGSFLRIDVLECPPNASFSFYGPKSLRVDIVKTEDVPPTQDGQEEAALRLVNEVDFLPPMDFVGDLVDLSVSGLGGWMRIVKTSGRGDGVIHAKVYGLRGLEVFARDVMPTG